jgi:hypothetical protein
MLVASRRSLRNPIRFDQAATAAAFRFLHRFAAISGLKNVNPVTFLSGRAR